ncbi:HWE histidine kinase domain-containing protein [Pelagerythrobacter sp.]|uniref:HWE histidine kinase domain-containing protein n=1 Tax=Pelagerythrobacter sp. TaxID=2800702 RepID=UPI0035B46256
MSGAGHTVDLTNCDREPIHKLGQIQDFGALLAVNADWMVVHHSVNVGEVLSPRAPVEPGVPVRDLFAAEAAEQMRDALSAIRDSDGIERLFGIDLVGDGNRFDVALHVSGALTVIEIEPHAGEAFASHIGSLRPMMADIEKQGDVEALCQRAAEQMKRLLGFDRVMVYKFHEDQSGEVIAEAREPELEAFQGLRYPKTDIPAQARALYLRNLLRIISDVNAAPVPIEPAVSLEGVPLDLSLSTLRSVSPIHIEYLKNMGVDASMSISIVVRGELWGLFACHHYSPRVLPYSLRTVAELFSQLFSLLIDRALTDARNEQARKGRAMHDRLMARMAGGAPLVENLTTIESVIREVIPHDGSSAMVEGVYQARGKAPAEDEFRALLPLLNSGSTSRVFASRALAEQIPAAHKFTDRAAGALVIPLSRRPRDYFVLWRRELPQVVTWAGNPEKPVEHSSHGARLTPRKSFEAWQESVSGESAPWTEAEMQIAESLRVTLLEVILRLTDEAIQDRARAQEQQELLIAELNHRVRNILNLIRSLINQSRHEAHDVGAFADLIGGRIGALAAAHDNITRENWSPASVHELIEAEAQAYLSGKVDRLTIEGDDVLIAPEAYTVLALVFHEMMTNSAKYGALCDSSGTLSIGLERNGGNLEISWRERGGPPVKPPERRGFGTMIIEKSIPFELKGGADIRYRLQGVEADFTVPARYVAAQPAGGRASPAKKADAKPDAGPAGQMPRHVLVVEDSMIIAMDTEDCLRQLGIKTVSISGNVAAALDTIADDRPEFAILDYNLGNESSEPVAQKLRELEIPFYFATGYGEANDALTQAGALGILKKPYGKDEIEGALSAFAGEQG